jgi:lipoprotein-releasing system ATP-binding protein
MSGLIVTDLKKTFSGQNQDLEILKGISFSLEGDEKGGSNIAVLGPSGSGKSTLLHIIGTLDCPTSGKLQLDGQDPFDLDEKGLAAFRNQNIGFVFQEHHLLPQLSVLENVLLPTLANGKSSANEIDRAKYLIERIGLAERIRHRPAELSGGERQRVAIARAMIFQPRIILADEPTGSLDQKNSDRVGEMLLEMQQAEKAMLITVTHSVELANRFARKLHFVDGLVTESDLDGVDQQERIES